LFEGEFIKIHKHCLLRGVRKAVGRVMKSKLLYFSSGCEANCRCVAGNKGKEFFTRKISGPETNNVYVFFNLIY